MPINNMFDLLLPFAYSHINFVKVRKKRIIMVPNGTMVDGALELTFLWISVPSHKTTAIIWQNSSPFHKTGGQFPLRYP